MTMAPLFLVVSESAAGLGITTRRVESAEREMVSRGGTWASSNAGAPAAPARQTTQPTRNRVAERDVAGLRGWDDELDGKGRSHQTLKVG